MQQTKGRIIDKLHRYTYTWVGPQSPSKWESHRRIQQVSNGLVQLGLLGLWGRTSWESYYHPFIPHQKLETTRRILRDSRRWKLGSNVVGIGELRFLTPDLSLPHLCINIWLWSCGSTQSIPHIYQSKGRNELLPFDPSTRPECVNLVNEFSRAHQ